jgi:hypothetical protein
MNQKIKQAEKEARRVVEGGEADQQSQDKVTTARPTRPSVRSSTPAMKAAARRRRTNRAQPEHH